MISLRHLLHFVSAATLFVAAIVLVPAGAQARAGHDHGPMKV
jgi:hypothetical protein